jgi:organic hydroperoxide reductase OsmC/OhrA
MSEHKATIHWNRESETFDYPAYNRNHTWIFESGVEVAASAAVQFLGDMDRVDPEEAFVAAISSCHMLTFLAICARKRIPVNNYSDRAVGFMEKNEQGKLAITRVSLFPKISYGGQPPAANLVSRIHHMSHQECFIANSVRTEIEVTDQGSIS